MSCWPPAGCEISAGLFFRCIHLFLFCFADLHTAVVLSTVLLLLLPHTRRDSVGGEVLVADHRVEHAIHQLLH